MVKLSEYEEKDVPVDGYKRDFNLHKLLSKKFKDKSLKQLARANVSSLLVLKNEQPTILQLHFGIKSVYNLAKWKYAIASEQLIKLDKYEKPSSVKVAEFYETACEEE